MSIAAIVTAATINAITPGWRSAEDMEFAKRSVAIVESIGFSSRRLMQSGPASSALGQRKFQAGNLSATRHSVFHIRPGIADEPVAVRHLDRRKRIGIERRIRSHQPVQVQDVRRHRVNLLIAERLRRVLRHRTANVVEQRRRIWPIAADGPDRLWRCYRALPTDEPITQPALALVAMA